MGQGLEDGRWDEKQSRSVVVSRESQIWMTGESEDGEGYGYSRDKGGLPMCSLSYLGVRERQTLDKYWNLMYLRMEATTNLT